MYKLPGITAKDAGAVVQKIQNNAPVASAPSKDMRTAAASVIVANCPDLLEATIGTPVTPTTPTNKPDQCSTASDDDEDFEEAVEEYCDDF